MGETFVGSEILTFRDGEMWVACWKHYYVCAQGESETQAVDRLFRTIAIEALIRARDCEGTFFECPVPAERLVQYWRLLHDEEHEPATVEPAEGE